MLQFTTGEKDLILSAIKYEKEIQDSTDEDEMDYVEEIEEEIQKENVFISRRQIDSIIIYLGYLLDRRDQYDNGEVLSLEGKLEDLSSLP